MLNQRYSLSSDLLVSLERSARARAKLVLKPLPHFSAVYRPKATRPNAIGGRRDAEPRARAVGYSERLVATTESHGLRDEVRG